MSITAPRCCRTGACWWRGGASSVYLNTVDVYDPALGTWSAVASLGTVRQGHTATLLPDGRVLVAGGSGTSGRLNSAEVYDPALGTWSGTGSLGAARGEHSATLLPDGQVLVAGGYNGSGPLSTAQVYDPALGTWSLTGSLGAQRYSHSATLLPNGRMLVAGGYNGNSAYLSSAEVYDPGLGYLPAWQPVLHPITPPLVMGQALTATGSGWRGHGYTEASGGATYNSATNYPLVRLYRLDNAQTIWLPTRSFSATTLTTLPLSGVAPGPALVWVVVNGIPSPARFVTVIQGFRIYLPTILR